MRRSTLIRLVIAGILVAALMVGVSAVTLANGQASGATVNKDFPCLLLAADSGLAIDLMADEKNIDVQTPSENDSLICHFDIPEGYEPAKAIKNTGFPCMTYSGITYDSLSVVTPGGKAVLTCKINPSQ